MKIRKWFNYFMLALVFVGAISFIILTIAGGVQTGDLSWVGLPIWLWNKSNMWYFFLGCFTVAGVSNSLFDYMNKSDDENSDKAGAALIMLLGCGFLWPIVWGVVFFDWFRKCIGKNEK